MLVLDLGANIPTADTVASQFRKHEKIEHKRHSTAALLWNGTEMDAQI